MSTVIENDVWTEILHSIKSKLSQESFNAWFRPIRFEGVDESQGVIHLCAPNQLVKDWVSSNYSSLVNQSLTERSLGGYLIGWTVDPENSSVSTIQCQAADLSQQQRQPAAPTTSSGPESTSPFANTSSGGSAAGVVLQSMIEPSLNAKYT